MALPIARETEQTLRLQQIANSSENVLAWPQLTNDDLVLFARIIHMYSTIDFLLRMTLEIMDDAGMLALEWRGKTAKLNMYKINEALRSAQIWNSDHLAAFADIEEYRRTRNLVAHFIARRFPDDNAYIFMTKSAADFEKVYGGAPPAGVMLYGVADAEQLSGIIPALKAIQSWLSTLPNDLSKPTGSPP